MRPSLAAPTHSAYVDGSRLDANWQLCGLCPRMGWAFAAADDQARIVAAAQGRPLGWVESIHGTELWALLMAAINTDPFTRLFGDVPLCGAGREKGAAVGTGPPQKARPSMDAARCCS